MTDKMKKLEEVKNTISNPDEATKVMSIIMEIIEEMEDKVHQIEKRQLGLEEKTAEIYDMLTDMEEELISSMNEEFEAECPYCGETIPFKIPEDEDEFECPNCHNVIELEMMFDKEDEGCHGSCGSCGGCHSEEDDDGEEDEEE